MVEELVVAVLIWSGTDTSRPAPDDGPEVIVRIHAARGNEPAWEAAAGRITSEIFAAAGLRVRWLNCLGTAGDQPVCGQRPRANEFLVRIVARSVGVAHRICGRSVAPARGLGHLVTVFQDCVSRESGRTGVVEALLAGHVIAHEIGHLLLPHGHAPDGLMGARLDYLALKNTAGGRLDFRRSEAAAMLEQLRRRIAASEERW